MTRVNPETNQLEITLRGAPDRVYATAGVDGENINIAHAIYEGQIPITLGRDGARLLGEYLLKASQTIPMGGHRSS